MISDIHARMAAITARFERPGPAVAPTSAPTTTAHTITATGGLTRPGGPAPGSLAAMWAAATNNAQYGGAQYAGLSPAPMGAGYTGPVPAAADRYRPAFEAAGARYGVDPALLAAVAWTESAFDPDAVSHAGAIGLMQIMPGTAAGLGVDPRDPVQAIDGAARYLRQQLDRFGDTRLALAAYNAGPGAVQKYGGVPPFDETVAYVGKVLGRYDQIRSVQ
jgi:soluble lytic murein transglycosylase-like protein